ncbi:MAG: hypothetical protein WKF83_11535 [Nocardioidaceae bacterium]
MGKLSKAAIAKKAADEARKPQNQQKLKDLTSKVRNRGGKAQR